jgi:hypothetical protein
MGVVQPIVVRRLDDGGFFPVDCRLGGLQVACLLNVRRSYARFLSVIRVAGEHDWPLELALIENLHREDLNPYRRSAGIRAINCGFLG